jgi:hypothetical protein
VIEEFRLEHYTDLKQTIIREHVDEHKRDIFTSLSDLILLSLDSAAEDMKRTLDESLKALAEKVEACGARHANTTYKYSTGRSFDVCTMEDTKAGPNTTYPKNTAEN